MSLFCTSSVGNKTTRTSLSFIRSPSVVRPWRSVNQAVNLSLPHHDVLPEVLPDVAAPLPADRRPVPTRGPGEMRLRSPAVPGASRLSARLGDDSLWRPGVQEGPRGGLWRQSGPVRGLWGGTSVQRLQQVHWLLLQALQVLLRPRQVRLLRRQLPLVTNIKINNDNNNLS